ncbi:MULTISPECIES: PH domain-containing protein [Bacillati]|uniref:PH domain-containing protein n=1 Tax=Bacillati TaxID=1783272 RepID=UPI000B9AA31A|nr:MULTISPECIES: PH domain-containing protein [Terrabacteria group]MED3677074.1 PH domain-containing protein [Bacillus velezensis]OZE89089.1 helicase [Rhodococcus sp. 15-2388-1-1a]
MGFISGLINTASNIKKDKVENELKDVLVPDEELEACFIVVRDLIIFTNKRLIVVDKQGLTGKKVEYMSIPYKSISRFSVETLGRIDIDSELKIWISGSELPVLCKKFTKDESILDIQRILANACL